MALKKIVNSLKERLFLHAQEGRVRQTLIGKTTRVVYVELDLVMVRSAVLASLDGKITIVVNGNIVEELRIVIFIRNAYNMGLRSQEPTGIQPKHPSLIVVPLRSSTDCIDHRETS